MNRRYEIFVRTPLPDGHILQSNQVLNGDITDPWFQDALHKALDESVVELARAMAVVEQDDPS